jgi:ketosteroid isomerase-like protein
VKLTLPWALLLLFSLPIRAASIEQEIDAQLWRPFLRASAAFDDAAFLALHSSDFVRVSLDRKEIVGLEAYAGTVREGFARARARGLRRHAEMRFLSRTTSATLAHETGYFYGRALLPDGGTRETFTRFEAIVRKEPEGWRLLLDMDSSEGGAITRAMYEQAASPSPELDGSE